MIDEYKTAQLEVQRSLAGEIDWFTSNDEKHFDPVSVISFLSGIMVSAFLAGFVDEAKRSAGNAGKNVYRKLEELVKSTLSGNNPNVNELDQLASQAKDIKAKLPENETILHLKRSQEHLEIYLKTNLPPTRAEKLASEIHAAVAKLL